MSIWIIGISGDSGSGKSTLSNAIKNVFDDAFVLECDRYHKWERSSINWKTYTHLNPVANDILSMQNDIFNLKNGIPIYQKNYDHKTGKFTEMEEIKPSKNIVVTGLHALYCEDKNLYNFKIFLDTDKRLKTKWKIQRDVIERNYEMEKVILQIKNREWDFKNFIYPQKNKADLIVNFFPISENNIGLRLYLNSFYDTKDIDTILNTSKIFYKKIQKNKSIYYEFKDDSSTSNLKDSVPIIRGDFYDYIVFFILKLRRK